MAPLVPVEPTSAALQLANLGFVASSDLPDRPGPAYLLVALRAVPTLRHFDPELVEYWGIEAGRGAYRALTRHTALPVSTDFSWGLIRITDRLKVTNEFLSFGGWLRADRVDDDVVAAFTSPAPILRRGGHSQGLDCGADAVGAWFGRLLLTIDFVAGFECQVGAADPTARYAAFLTEAIERYRHGETLRGAHPEFWNLLVTESRRLQASDPGAWRAGEELRAVVESLGRGRSIDAPSDRSP